MRTIDRGFQDQYMLRKPSRWPMIPALTFRHSQKRMKTIQEFVCAPPRWCDLFWQLEKHGLLDVWIYRNHLESLLRPIAVTTKSAFGILWRQRSEFVGLGALLHKDGVHRFIGEYLGKPLNWNQGVLVMDSGATKSEAQEFFTMLTFGLGAYGGTLEKYPIPGLSYLHAIVNVTDEKNMREFIRENNRARHEARRFAAQSSSKNARPIFDIHLHLDLNPGRLLPFDGVAKILAQPLPDEARSHLSVRDQRIDAVQKKLDELRAMLGVPR